MRERKMLGMGLIIGSAVTSGVVCSKAVTSLLGATAVSGTMGALGSVLWPLLLVVVGALLGFGLYRLGCLLHDKFGQESEIEKKASLEEPFGKTNDLLRELIDATMQRSGIRLTSASSTTSIYNSADDRSNSEPEDSSNRPFVVGHLKE
jgi:hypothetical protein